MIGKHYSAQIEAQTSAISPSVWNSLVPSTNGLTDNPFLDHAFFLALEQSGCATPATGWLPQHIVLRDETDTAIGLMPLFLKSHSQGEYVFDQGWANALERAGGHYYPKLQGSIPFTPATAPKLLVLNGDLEAQAALLQAAQQLTQSRQASSAHLTFVPEQEANLANGLGWLQRTDTQFHWFNRGYDSFEHFLETLSSRKRKIIRRERRDALADGLTIRWLTGSDIKESHWDAFFDFYEDTGSRKWGRPYLNREFFSLIGQSMADRILLIFAYDGDQAIAGAINFIGKDRLYGRNWGATRDVPFLHFEVCYYQAIDFAIQNKLAVVEAGAQGEHKLARGYEPVATHSIHHIAHPGLRQAVEDYLTEERQAVEQEQKLLEGFTPFRRGERL